jgi:predicted S18 family serine protease
MRVDFHSLYDGKAGDSAGVTIATSAYTALRKSEVRQNVAMTGSIRADGAVKAVGGVPEKIGGAFLAENIEMVIVPRENLQELNAIPVDQLLTLTVVVADDIKTYIEYATIPTVGPSEPSSVPYASVQESLSKLRTAQVLLRLGEREEAMVLLSSVAESHPEIYNAQRLLDLIGHVSTPGGPKSNVTVSRSEVERVVNNLKSVPPAVPPSAPTTLQASPAPSR